MGSPRSGIVGVVMDRAWLELCLTGLFRDAIEAPRLGASPNTVAFGKFDAAVSTVIVARHLGILPTKPHFSHITTDAKSSLMLSPPSAILLSHLGHLYRIDVTI